MMPDLGQYAVEVLLAYAVTVSLIAGIVIASVRQAKKARRALEEAEARWRA